MARILVIDESAAMRRLLRFMLNGHEIIEARFGLEALRIQEHGPFTLVICDVELPDVTPDELYTGLIDTGYTGPFLFLAARLDIIPRDRSGSRLPVLYKPVDAEALQAKVEALLTASGAPLLERTMERQPGRSGQD